MISFALSFVFHRLARSNPNDVSEMEHASRESTTSGVGAFRVRASADTVSSAAEAVSDTKLVTRTSPGSTVGIDGRFPPIPTVELGPSGEIRPVHKGYDPREDSLHFIRTLRNPAGSSSWCGVAQYTLHILSNPA